MFRPKNRGAAFALVLAAGCCLPGELSAQDTARVHWGGLGGFRRWDAQPVAATPLPEPVTRPRRWTLYFPSDWRYPAIVHPPLKVYLDPPYEVEDPFGRIPPNDPPEEVEPEPDPPAVTPPPPIPKPKVLELNPDTGLLEERSPQTFGRGGTMGSAAEPAHSPPAVQDAAPSPFGSLRRWDGND